MTPAPLPAPVGLADLALLTTRGLAAFAARTARRALPLLGLADDDPTQTALDQLRAAVRKAEAVAAGVDSPNELSEEYVLGVYDAAEEVSGRLGHAGYAAAHAARSVRYAGLGNFMEVVASAFGTTRALFQNAPTPTSDLITTALRADCDKLVSLRLGLPGEEGPPVDPSEGGPLGSLWPAGRPVWVG